MNINKELDELFNDPLLDIGAREQALFDIPADMKLVVKKKKADYVAQYKPCEDFERYKPMFQKVHAELRAGQRNLIKIAKTANLTAKHFYIVDGVMLYLESVGQLSKDPGNGLPNGRTHCILENGKEADILLQTLRKNVIGSGYGISATQEETAHVFNLTTDIHPEDVCTGYIYVLKSLSANAQIAAMPNLYKIGFTINAVEERIANAENEPTYLMAPVEVVGKYKIMNMNSHVFESLIHQVLDSVQMQITVHDAAGHEHHPKEWFMVPIGVVDTIIQKISDGTITQYTYNPTQQCLEKVIKKAESTFDVSGYKVLTLPIKKVYFDDIMSGKKKIEYRVLKQTTLNKYTYVDDSDGKRYLKWYDMLRLGVGYNKNRETALVQVMNITHHEGLVEFHLGAVLEHIIPE